MLTRLLAVLATLLMTGVSKADYRTESIADEGPRFKMEIIYPQIGNAAIDADIKAFAKEIADEFGTLKKKAANNEMRLPHDEPFTGELTSGGARDDDKLFTVTFDWTRYVGEGRLVTIFFARTYLKPSGRRIMIAELLGREGLQSLAKLMPGLVRDDLGLDDQLNREKYDPDLVTKGTAPLESNYEAYTWDEEGLVFRFSAGQVGTQYHFIRVAMKDIKPLMRADPLAPLASFDCFKAKTATEKEICADWKLARADRVLDTLYQVKLRNTDATAQKEEVKQAQRNWLKERDDACGKLAPEALRTCLSEKMSARTKALKPSLAGIGYLGEAKK